MTLASDQSQETGFPWGIIVALIADVIISFGLALQKVAHNKVKVVAQAQAKMTYEGKRPPPPHIFKQKVWWIGIAMTIGAEVGNFAAYGDKSTPSSVVASVGCVAVISNWLIATLWLKEQYRKRDIGGVAMVVLGVILIIVFVPKNPLGGTQNLVPCPIVFSSDFASHKADLPTTWYSGTLYASNPFDEGSQLPGVEVCEMRGILAVGSDYWFWLQPIWLAYFGFCLVALVLSLLELKRWGHKHVTSFLVPANIAGGLTVSSAVTVSSFLFGRAFGTGQGFVLARDRTSSPHLLGCCTCLPLAPSPASVRQAEPIFFGMVALLAVTAVFQVGS